MTMTDPIADMLTRVRNAQSAGKDTVSMPTSKKLVEIVRIMEQEGYIQRFDVIDGEHGLHLNHVMFLLSLSIVLVPEHSNYLAFSTIFSKRQRFILDSGRVSMI